MNRRSFMKKLPCIILLAGSLAAADWKPLFNGKNLDGWEVIGDGQWTVMADGTLLGQRIGDLRKMLTPGGPLPTPQQFKGWVDTQSWLYTRRSDFGEFDRTLNIGPRLRATAASPSATPRARSGALSLRPITNGRRPR